jgi:hypothetical protein
MRRLVVPVAVAVVAVMAGVSAGVLSLPAASGQFALQPLAVTTTTVPNQTLGLLPASPQLTTRIVLSRTHVVEGSPIKGFVVVINRGKLLKLWDHSGPLECTPGYAVTLTNRRFPPDAAFFADCGTRPLVIPSGVTRLPVTVITTYQGCSPSNASKTIPKCLSGRRMPPLPAGQYRAVLVGLGLRLPAPKAVSVTLSVGVGTVRGRLEQVGGPPSLSPRGLPGTVVFTLARYETVTLAPTGHAFRFATTPKGYYRAAVPAGTYEVTGFPSTGGECRALHLVHVRVHSVITSFDVICNVM